MGSAGSKEHVHGSSGESLAPVKSSAEPVQLHRQSERQQLPQPHWITQQSTLEQLSNSYKQETSTRVATKAAMAGVFGLLVGPIANRGPVVNTAIVTAVNGLLVMGFYDVVREALTSLTVSDTPMMSLTAGALTGYVWNGMVHQAKAQAVGGAIVVGTVAAVSHSLMPSFDAYKFALSVLLDTGIMKDDSEGSLRAQAAAPPVLTPWSHLDARASVLDALAKILPFRPITDEEYEKMRTKDPIVVSARGVQASDGARPSDTRDS